MVLSSELFVNLLKLVFHTNSNVLLNSVESNKQILGRYFIHYIPEFLVLQPQTTLGRRFGTSKMYLSLPVSYTAVRFKAAALLLLFHCLYYSLCESL